MNFLWFKLLINKYHIVNKLILSFVCFLFLQVSKAQEVVFYFAKKEFIPTEITLSDGTIKKGYIKDFTLPRTVEFRGFLYDYKKIESKLLMDRKIFKFKSAPDATVENIDFSNISSLILKGEDTIRYDKLKLKTVNSDLEVVDLNMEIMAPLAVEGKINIYALKVYECSGGCQLSSVLVYLKKPEDEYAMIPIDMNTITLFNYKKTGDKFARAIEEVGADCPEFLAFMTAQKELFEAPGVKKGMRDEYMKYKKQLEKEAKQKFKKTRDRVRYIEDMHFLYLLKKYIEIEEAYASRCD